MKTSFMQTNSTESPLETNIELVALINLAEYVVLNVALKIQMQVSTQEIRRVLHGRRRVVRSSQVAAWDALRDRQGYVVC